MPAKNNDKIRAWCFTKNNPTVYGQSVFSGLMGLRYGICSLEMSKSGTPHLQGYLEMEKPVRFSWFKGSALEGGHFEPRRGTRDQARDYCLKEVTHIEGPWEHGKWCSGGQGKRNDLQSVVDRIKEKVCLDDVASEFPLEWVKYHKGFVDLQARVAPEAKRDPNIDPTVIFIHGKSGCGKSRKALEIAGPEAHYQDNGKWWDGYRGQEWVILDDFAGSTMAYKDFKRIIDRYAYRVETKGGSRELVTTKFIITSTKMPDEWWNNERVNVDLTEINRRITKRLYWRENENKFEEI